MYVHMYIYIYVCIKQNTKGAKKCKANQEQQLLTKKSDITLRPKCLEYNDIMLTMAIAS